jgi:PIN domain nuclease of toxin-antitoxin system
VNLLLVSHTFLWFVWDDLNLSQTAKSLIEDPANLKLVSVASCWEIAIKVGLKKLSLGEPVTTFLPRESSGTTRDCAEKEGILTISRPLAEASGDSQFHAPIDSPRHGAY